MILSPELTTAELARLTAALDTTPAQRIADEQAAADERAALEAVVGASLNAKEGGTP